jgi:hypothetical protein
MPKPKSVKKRPKRLIKRIMKGCAKKKSRRTIRGGFAPSFNVGISKFYTLNELSTDVQRNITVDRGVISGGNKKTRYSRKYLFPMKGGALQGLTPLEYKPSMISSDVMNQPIAVKYSDSNPYLV